MILRQGMNSKTFFVPTTGQVNRRLFMKFLQKSYERKNPIDFEPDRNKIGRGFQTPIWEKFKIC